MTNRPLRQLGAIESCLGCPWVRERVISHPFDPKLKGIQFYCNKAKRLVAASDGGVSPPPEWCPLPPVVTDNQDG